MKSMTTTTTPSLHSIKSVALKTKRICVRWLLLLALGVGWLGTPAFGATLSWSGGSATTANWNDSGNWGFAGTPANGDTLIFSALQPRLINTNNLAGLTLNQIRFVGAGGGYAIFGNALTITNGIEATNTVGANVLSNNITLGTPTDFVVEVATGAKLTLGGTLSGSVGLIKSGGGTNLLAGGFSNTYSGTTTVSNGVVELFKNGAGATAVPHDLIIGNGLVAATVRNLAVLEIADAANVTVNRLSLWDLNNHDEAISSLTLSGGSVDSSMGTMTLGGNLTTLGSATTATILGNMSLGGATRTFSVGSGTAAPDFVISANISGLPGDGINKTGSGQMTLSGVNTYTGPTTLSGFVILANDSALGANGSATNGTTLAANTFLLVQGVNVGNEFLTLSNADDFRSSGAANWAGPVSLAGDVVINVFGGTFTNSGTITGTGGITKGQTGTLIYSGSGANTYSGDTIVNQGILQLAKSVATAGIVNGTITIGDDIGGSDADVIREMGANQINSALPITINSSGLLDLNNFTDAIGAITFSGGHLSTGTGTAILVGTVTANANTNNLARIDGIISLSSTRIFDVAQGIWSPDLRVDAAVLGLGGLTKIGLGEMSLTSSNSYSGLTTLSTGYLDVEDSSGLGSTNTGTVVANGAVLALLFGVHVGLEPLTLNGTGAGIFGGLSSSFGSNSWAGAIALGTNSIVSVMQAADFLNLSGTLSGTGDFTKIGPGTLIFSGSTSNSYSGNTFMNEGLMLLGKTVFDGAIPNDLTVGDGVGSDVVRNISFNQIPNTSKVTVNTGGLLDLNSFVEGVGSLVLTGGAVDSGSSTFVIFGSGVTGNASSTVATINGNLSLSGSDKTFNIAAGAASPDLQINANITGAGLFKTGPGNLRLAGNNSYAGLTTIDNGFIQVSSATGLGATNVGTVIVNGGSLLVEGVSVVGEALTNNLAAAQFQSTGASGWSGNIVMNADLNFLTFGGTLDLSGIISGSGAVQKSQSGTLIYSGGLANSYTNTTKVISGALQLNKTVTDGSIHGDLTIGDGAGGANADVVKLVGNPQLATVCNVTIASSGLLDLNEISEGISTLSGAGEVDTGSTGTGALVLNGNGSTTYTGLIIGAGSIFKSGTGIFTLSGNNTYTGLTTANNGTLLVNGSQPQSPVSVGSIATLGGSGIVGNVAASGNIAPGNSPGTLTTSNVVFTGTGDYFVELTGPNAGTDYDQLNVRGTNALANALLHVTAAFTAPVGLGQKFTIINNDLADAITGTFNGLPEGATITSGSFTFTISYVGGTGNDAVLTLSSIPGAVLSSKVTAGNGSHSIDPNGCNNFDLVITNNTGLVMTGLNATLSTTTPGVVITQPYSTYPNTNPGGKGTNNAPFQISTLPNFVCGTDINLQLSLNSSLGSFTMNFTQATGESSVPTRFDNSTVTNVPDIGSIDSTNLVAAWAGGAITKVAVSLWLVAPFSADMTLSLIAPDGTTVLLASGVGAGANFGTGSAAASRTTFDDSAATAITAGASSFVGTFRPQGSLASFNGIGTINGAWHLHIVDGFGSGSPDTLRNWSLFLSGTACATGSGACDYCLTSLTGSITNTDLLLTNRLIRNGIEASCGAPKVWPFFADFATHRYDLYTFTNTSAADACVTVLLNGAGDLQACVYLNAFDPSNLATNYVGDSGASTLTGIGSGVLAGPQSCSAEIPAGAKFFVEVYEVTSGVGSTNYTLQLSGLPCPPPPLNIDPVPSNQARLSWPTWAGGYKLEATPSLLQTNYVTITNEPIVTSLKYNVTNATGVPTNRFYRLHKP